jgi:hypothetical protein
MRTANRARTRQLEYALQFNCHAQGSKSVNDPLDALKPLSLERGQAVDKQWIAVPDEVAEDVGLSTLFLGTHFDTGHQLDLIRARRDQCIVHASDRVMVGQAQDEKPPPFGLVDQIGGGEIPV